MIVSNIAIYIWIAFGLLVLGGFYLLAEEIKVHKIFGESIVSKLVKILVAVMLIQLASLAIVSFTLLFYDSQAAVVLLPTIVLWIVSLGFAIFGIRSAKHELNRLIK